MGFFEPSMGMRYNVFMTELTIMANIAQECQDEQEREEG
jgi:hypothetical protein